MKNTIKHIYQINEEPNEFDDHLLDVIGSSFSFDHVKGIGEWIKNSVDAYLREGSPDERHNILLRFTDGNIQHASIECIDFVGMTNENIVKALKRWGDPDAAKRGKSVKVYGGHGNGGKFYMRQMFEESYYITYRDYHINIFGFSGNKKYGFAQGYKNKKVGPNEALKIAGIDNVQIPSEIKDSILTGKKGFTVVKGNGPKDMRKSVKVKMICGRLKNHPQVRRLLKNIPLQVVYNNRTVVPELKPDPLLPFPGFERIEPIKIPSSLDFTGSTGAIVRVEISDPRYAQGELRLYTSEVAMDRSRYEDLNRIDIIGELGVIGSYKLQEIPTQGYFPQLAFIYGECECPMLENPEADCVQNDRSKLVENDITKALIEWIGREVGSLAAKINEKEKKQQQVMQHQISSMYNNFLDDWKNKFMSRVYSTILVGPGEGPGSGNGIGGSLGEFGFGKGNGKKSGGGPGENPGGGNTEKKSKKFPRILLSGDGGDPDPLSDTGDPLILDPRHGVIYQRPQDAQEGIYWINTASPLAVSILEHYNADHPRWRDYLLQRYIDIFTQEALERLEKKDPDQFNNSTVNQQIKEVIMKVQEAASKDLRSFLFDDQFKPLE